ncbi:hypothetical protein [uncultured Parabacteroides sp.]|jgi:hypothetical protein|nr:hypothetical protein [uncultured Parabacteroides sp.]
MAKYEYKVISPLFSLEKELNKWAKEDWELFIYSWGTAILRREIKK